MFSSIVAYVVGLVFTQYLSRDYLPVYIVAFASLSIGRDKTKINMKKVNAC